MSNFIVPPSIFTDGVDVSGTGFLAGEFPGGRTTINGVPTSASVKAFYVLESGDWQLAGQATSNPDGTWLIGGINHDLRFNVVGQLDGYNDVVMANIKPMRTDMITYDDAYLQPNEDFNGMEGYILLLDGLPPFTVSGTQSMPAGLFPVVNGRQLIIDGTTTDDDVFNSTVRITSSNGVTKDVPVKLVVGFKAPANFEAETLEDAGAFSVVLTWEVTNSTQEVRVFKSATPFDLESMPAPIATLTGNAVSYTDDDVIEDDVFHYMVASVCEGFTLYSDEVREVVVVCDPHWDNVVALLHFDGDFYDASGKSWCTPMAGAGISTEVFKFGSGSFSLDGSGQYAVLSGLELALGTGDFTIEMFARRDGWSDHSTGEVFLIDTRVGGSDQLLIDINNSVQRRLRYHFGGNERIAQVDAIHSGFSHVAVSRMGGVSRLFVDGVSVGQVSDTLNVTATTWHIGGRFELYQGSRLSWNGNIDDLRITKGVARYTENFIPPTKPFPNF